MQDDKIAQQAGGSSSGADAAAGALADQPEVQPGDQVATVEETEKDDQAQTEEPAAPLLEQPLVEAHAPPRAPAHAGRGGSPILPIILAATAIAGAWLIRRLVLRGRTGAPTAAPSAAAAKAAAASAAVAEAPPSPPPEPVDPDTFSPILLPPPAGLAPPPGAAVTPASSLPPPLAGVPFMVSEDIDLSGTPTTFGAGTNSCVAGAAAASAPAVGRLLAAGAVCVGKAAMQPLGLDVLGANYGNPYNKAHIAGGGQTGGWVLAVEPNNRQAREDLHHLQQMKADMASAQQRMVSDFQKQRLLATGAAGGAPQPYGGGGGGGGPPPGFLPPGFDPGALPPGFDWSQLAAAGGPEAMMSMLSGDGGGMQGGGGFGPMFGGGGGGGR
ncbi:hypothetical protein TSOC_004194 [Tetrabaena socialis]|uniref:Amidase domain-containing protein n=1 Tax=Tetrabaena socialis TaxID=47790 RepID=A0A2J8A9L3_9CHLO|nr:hypothetical protein TSOC_004194 [Tetrabaena socialis]|eukprot:PNH09212.1 hypothetical protein TSOC_004194 [Tetrabaena socialis]